MKKYLHSYLTISFLMTCLVGLNAATVSSIQDLDDNALFHFSLFSDNKGFHAGSGGTEGERMTKALAWMRSSDFVLGLGDHTKGSSTTWRNFIKNDSFYNSKFYPSIGDGECETYGSGQGDWSAGRKFFSELPGFWNRQNMEANTLFSPVNGNYPDYYWFYEKGGVKVHLISLTFSDSASFHADSRTFMMNKVTELAATKTNNDIIFLLAHNGNRAINRMGLNNTQKDIIFSTCDFIGDASSHRHERFTDNDASHPNGAIWYNSGGVCVGGATQGYFEFHVFENPTRFTVQYINVQHESTRVLHPTAYPGVRTGAPELYGERYPYLKEINGPITEIRDWSTFQLAPPEPNGSGIVSSNVPDEIMPGETVSVSITMENNGLDTWSTAAGHSLGRPSVDSTWGTSRLALPHNVSPDQQVTFNFDITAPLAIGTYDFERRMVDDAMPNQGWFGPALSKGILVDWPIVNQLSNASFEEGGARPDSWNVPGAYSRSSEQSRDGNYSLKGTGTGSIGVTSQTVSLTPNTDYNISVWINFLSGGSGNLIFDTQDKFDGAGQGQFVIGSPNGGWTKYSGSFNSGAETSVTIRVFTNASFNGTFYVDDVKLEDPNDRAPANFPPVFNSTAPAYADAGSFYSYTPNVTDADGDPIVYTPVQLPPWLNFNSNNGQVSGTPSVSNIGSNAVTIQADDGFNLTNHSFDILVSAAGNDAPVINSTPGNAVIENQLYSYGLSASDPDGDSLTFSASLTPTWLSFDSVSGTLSGTPSPAEHGAHAVTLSVSDGTETVEQSFSIAVFPTPTASNIVANASFENGGANPTSWSLGNAATGSSERGHDGNSSLKLTNASSPTTQTISLEPNTDYNISVWVDASSMTTGNAVFDTGDVFDGAGQGQFVIYNANSGWEQYSGSFNSGTTTSITLRMFGSGMVGTVYFDNVVVSQPGGGNLAPVITSVPDTTFDVQAHDGVGMPTIATVYDYQITAVDLEGDTLVYNQVSIPSWLTFNAGTATLTGDIPVATQSYPVTVSVSDGEHTVQQNFTISTTDVTPDLQPDPESDDDNDGVPYILEFALGGNPAESDASVTAPVTTRNTNSIDFKFRRAEASITYTIEKSTDLINWTDHITVTDTHGVVGSDCTVPVAISEMTDGKLFLRLKVED